MGHTKTTSTPLLFSIFPHKLDALKCYHVAILNFQIWPTKTWHVSKSKHSWTSQLELVMSSSSSLPHKSETLATMVPHAAGNKANGSNVDSTIAPIKTLMQQTLILMWEKKEMPHVSLPLHSQNGQSWSNSQLWTILIKVGKEWWNSQTIGV